MKKTLSVLIYVMIGVVMVVTVYLLGANRQVPNTLSIAVKTNGGVPYKWEFEIANPDIVEFVKSEVTDDKNGEGMVGAPITTDYYFRGLSSGVTTITFKYVSIVDGKSIKEEKHKVRVGKDNNISYVVSID